jgi:predicted glycosyl hydrolase (DUF1957 family)
MFPGYQTKTQRLVRAEKNRAELSELNARLLLNNIKRYLEQRIESLEAEVKKLKADSRATVNAHYGRFKSVRRK